MHSSLLIGFIESLFRYAGGLFVYCGGVHRGKRHGHGVWRSVHQQCTYAGVWANDKRNGYGVQADQRKCVLAIEKRLEFSYSYLWSNTENA